VNLEFDFSQLHSYAGSVALLSLQQHWVAVMGAIAAPGSVYAEMLAACRQKGGDAALERLRQLCKAARADGGASPVSCSTSVLCTKQSALLTQCNTVTRGMILALQHTLLPLQVVLTGTFACIIVTAVLQTRDGSGTGESSSGEDSEGMLQACAVAVQLGKDRQV
jgi:hypothetical protein